MTGRLLFCFVLGMVVAILPGASRAWSFERADSLAQQKERPFTDKTVPTDSAPVRESPLKEPPATGGKTKSTNKTSKTTKEKTRGKTTNSDHRLPSTDHDVRADQPVEGAFKIHPAWVFLVLGVLGILLFVLIWVILHGMNQRVIS